MFELVKQGKSILMISSDMEELLGISDRIMVISEGRWLVNYTGMNLVRRKYLN